MKKLLLSFFCIFAMAMCANAETYSHVFAEGELVADGGTVTLNGFDWVTPSVSYVGFDSNNAKGAQIGRKAEVVPLYTLTSSAFSEYEIKSVTVNSSVASSGDAVMTISVGDKTSAEYKLTGSSADYTFAADGAKGDIVITWKAGQRAYYVKSIVVEYTIPAGMIEIPAPVFTTPTDSIYADEVYVEANAPEAVVSEGRTVIYYTIDGSMPSHSDYHNSDSTSTIRSGYSVIYQKLTESATIKAITVIEDANDRTVMLYSSEMSEASFIVSPTKPYLPVKEVTSGSKYAISAGDSVLYTLLGKKRYGYLPTVAASLSTATYIETTQFNGFTFSAVEGGYTIRDAAGCYLFMKDEYNSFNLSDEMPAEGAVWSVAFNDDGKAVIKNVLKDKTIYYSAQYDSYGCYPADKVTDEMSLPSLYLQRDYPEYSIDPANRAEIEMLQTITIVCPLGIKASEGLIATVHGMNMKVAQADDNTLTLSLDEPLRTKNSEYVTIELQGEILLDPAGLCYPLKWQNRYNFISYTITGTVDAAKVEKVSPENGATIDALSYILFTFTYYAGKDDNTTLEPKLYKEGNPDVLFPVEFTRDNEEGTGFVAMLDGAIRVIEPITEAGTYILEIPEGYFIDGNGKSMEAVTLKYHVTGETAIDAVTENINSWTVFSLDGVKIMETGNASQLNTLSKGIYIINGVKFVVK